jgi:hypothetical protein
MQTLAEGVRKSRELENAMWEALGRVQGVVIRAMLGFARGEVVGPPPKERPAEYLMGPTPDRVLYPERFQGPAPEAPPAYPLKERPSDIFEGPGPPLKERPPESFAPTAPLARAAQQAKAAGETVKQTFLKIEEIGRRVFERLGDVLSDFFRNAIRGTASLKDAWNALLDIVADVISQLIAAGLTQWIGKATGMAIPAAQYGGIVTRPTLALVGEAGPEAIIPLDRAGMGGTVNVTINAVDAPSFQRLLRQNPSAVAEAAAIAVGRNNPLTRPRWRRNL